MLWMPQEFYGDGTPRRIAKAFLAWICLAALTFSVSGCVHYPVNQRLTHYDPQAGYRGRNFAATHGDSQTLLLLSFSGGGTRAAAFSYGVLETLRDTAIKVDGQEKRLLDQVSWISAVSGGSFTAAYYGLFGDRIFEDYEARFLKKNIQGELFRSILFNPVNWVRLFSAYYDRSDLASEYYDRNVFDGGTFADILARQGPIIVINATDMFQGTRVSFIQDAFDVICSDLSGFHVARACAASSAVPMVLTPVTLKNYAGDCGYEMPPTLAAALKPPKDVSSRRFDLANNMVPFLDSKKKSYIHLVDGGVSDNLGLRAAIERVTLLGDCWTTLKAAGLNNIHKIVFIVVNAQTEIESNWNRLPRIPGFGAMLDSYSSISIGRYNMETLALLRESFPRWADEIRKGRCGDHPISTEPGGCGDIEYYLVEVRFDALNDESESAHLKRLPTSFALKPEDVDRLRMAARQILEDSAEFRRLVKDLQ